MDSNKEIRVKAKTLKISLWQVANKMGISESTLTRLLRKELDQENKAHLLEAINILAKEGGHDR